ncbi:MAG: ribbon-helix-helix protein, CopG family [SAR202 cluster bacterium]|nr:ribbon-helix-helix protein, CopG family [SAR202 cluster bacterium]
MQRITTSLPDDLMQRLRAIAVERNISMAPLVREAIEEKVNRHRPKPRSFGIGASGYTDTAMRSAVERPKPSSWN